MWVYVPIPAQMTQEELYYLISLRILVKVCESELRRLFKEVWNNSQYAQQPWQDDPDSGDRLFRNHKPDRVNRMYDDIVKTGQRDDWDMTVLCRVYIQYSFMNSIDKKYSENADTLRKIRNEYAHSISLTRTQGEYYEDLQKVTLVFQNLNLNEALIQQALIINERQAHTVLREELNGLKVALGYQVVPDWFSSLPETFRHNRVTEQDLVKIVSHIGGNWELVAVELGIKKQDREKAICTHRSVDLQMMEVFMKWVQRESRRATREAFIIALFACNDMCTIDWDGIEEAAKHLR